MRAITDIPEGNTRRTTSAWDALRAILYAGNVEEADAFARIMEEVEAARKCGFGRTADFRADQDR